ncbi:MAG: hypothetical protein U9P49_01880 [Thermodesulfobacteriota bacterium]|nr:hypothetical protein [Thermodesulfobacteriota bacterium]
MNIKIVLRYIDGRILKGSTYDFSPVRQSFHFSPINSSDDPIEVNMRELKAVFFVKDFEGNPSYKERTDFTEGTQTYGQKVEVTFADDERLAGTTTGYDLERLGFFLFPADPKGNNIRVFVVSTAVSKVRLL